MNLPTASQVPSLSGPLRVMVVDDSLVLRGVITKMINEDPTVATVVASAANGKIAVERAQKKDIDVVILDIEMPVMDGITALPLLLASDPKIVVIMASTLTTRNAEISFKAMAAGAKDYVPKPSSVTPGSGAEEFKRELLEKVKALGRKFRRSGLLSFSSAPGATAGAVAAVPKATAISLRKAVNVVPQVLAIGSSTGGPHALQHLFKLIPAPLKIPTFITQHMPPTFTGLLAQTLDRETGHRCVEAKDGEVAQAGKVYIAPGDFHMTLVRKGTDVAIKLNQAEKENFCRPAVDPMLRSIAEVYQRNVLVGILTGMGQDGLKGCEVIIKAGGNVAAQDEATSIVWGMPGAVAKAGLCFSVSPITQLAQDLSRMIGR